MKLQKNTKYRITGIFNLYYCTWYTICCQHAEQIQCLIQKTWSGSNSLDTWFQVKEVEMARKYMFEWDTVIIQGEWLKVVVISLETIFRLGKWCEKIKWMCMGQLEKLISNHIFWHSWKLENKQGRSQEMTLDTVARRDCNYKIFEGP